MNEIKSNKILNSLTLNKIVNIWQTILNNKYYRIGLGVLVGFGLGTLYWNFIGCNSGTCPLTSSPFKTVALFGLLGGLFAYDKKTDKESDKQQNN